MLKGTNNYEDALKKAEIAEETSDVEAKWQEWVQRDRNSRKVRAQKDLDNDNIIPLKKAKKVEGQSNNKSEEKHEENEKIEHSKPTDLPLHPPEVLIKSSENNDFSNSEDFTISAENSRADEITREGTDNFYN